MSGLAKLPPAVARQLAKVAGMMGSEHDGEALNAARAAGRILADHGVTWAEALTPAAPVTAPRAPWRPVPVPPTTAFVRKVLACRDHPALFNQREREFLRDMDAAASSGRQPSAGQSAWLDRLHARAFADNQAMAA